MAIHELEGRDAPRSEPADSDTTNVPPGGRGKILLSMLGTDGIMRHFVVVLPATYLEAKAMAFDCFHVQIASAGSTADDIVLKLGVKSSSGVIVWASIRPEQWADVVSNGDEIRVGGGNLDPGLMVTFGRMGYNYREKPEVFEYTTFLLPDSYTKESQLEAKLQQSLNPCRFNLHRVVEKGVSTASIPRGQWLTIIRRLIEKDPYCEILVN
ncbi:hypothetical protein M413DRAFT_282662 [Hebeloma cylindrosporum]|uniref:Uncharacterized protein n=1 Tax=Hebeloma cylindrosporum TaxID=76867 RepID=A0A0C3BZS6_HEBCY|nr:hypothetical protein M413DRAFT_282662 [Hebeloma cylindrosporum h7]